MALYQDGILISGANTLPQMTLAEYNALPADQRPTYWERLDADYDDVVAEKTDIATVESGTTASRAYSVGELVYVSGTLYRVKTAIASGATFTVGTNIEVYNISNAVYNLTSQIAKKNRVESNLFTFTSGKRILNLSQLVRKSIKTLINVYANGDIPVHSYALDGTPNNFQIMMVLDGNYSTYTGDVSMTIIYDEV